MEKIIEEPPLEDLIECNNTERIILPKHQFTKYNGIKAHWFIGDFNRHVGAWEAWGSCNNKAYQLWGWFIEETRELYGMKVLKDKENHYYDEATHKMLTQ